jgi:hypothetical protein
MPMTIEELESALLAVTDQVGKLMDRALKKGMVPVFRCGHSGLLLPADYVKEWGRLYGIGLGPDPVSEVLNSDYTAEPAAITPRIRKETQIMHPVVVCKSQVDFDWATPEEFEAEKAILAKDDARCERRAAIVWQKQLVNPRSRLPVYLKKFGRA